MSKIAEDGSPANPKSYKGVYNNLAFFFCTPKKLLTFFIIKKIQVYAIKHTLEK